jgi:hypothetical protein
MRVKFEEAQMSVDDMSGAVLIRESTALPVHFDVRTELVFPGWRAVRGLDGHELGRNLQKANWNFFNLAGEIQTIALGRRGPASSRRAVRRILRKLQRKQFNCLEITEITQKRFLGFPFVSVAANLRHIQESVYLVPVVGAVLETTAAAAPETKFDSDEGPHHAEVLTKQDAAVI